MYYADREQYWPENIMPEKMQEILLLFIWGWRKFKQKVHIQINVLLLIELNYKSNK